MEAELAQLKREKDEIQSAYDEKTAELSGLRRDLTDVLSENYWWWQGDGMDHPESIVCPIIIKPEALRAILRANAELAETVRGLTERLEHLIAVVPDPPMIGNGVDSPPEHATQEDHEIGYALHLARALLAEQKDESHEL